MLQMSKLYVRVESGECKVGDTADCPGKALKRSCKVLRISDFYHFL